MSEKILYCQECPVRDYCKVKSYATKQYLNWNGVEFPDGKHFVLAEDELEKVKE